MSNPLEFICGRALAGEAVSRRRLLEHTFHPTIAAGQGGDPPRPKSSNKSVDTVENAGLTLVEPVDSNSSSIVGRGVVLL